MIEKLIAFLQWIQANERLRNRVDTTFSMLFLFITGLGAYRFLKEILFQKNYSYIDGNDSYDPYMHVGDWILHTELTENTLIFSLIIFLTVSLIGIYLYGVYARIRNRGFSVVGLVINSALPVFTGIIMTALYVMEPSFTQWYILIFGGLYTFSAYILCLSSVLKGENKIWNYSLDFYKKYIIAFLIGFLVFIILYFLGDFDEFRYMDFSELVLFLTMICIPYSIITWMILTYAWTTLTEVSESSWKNILRGGIGIAFLFIVIWLSPNWKNIFIDNRIEKAQSLIQEYGETQEGYEKASSIWGLQWAMKESFLESRLYQKDLYAKIFDQSIESDIEDDVDVNKYKSWNSNATNMLARGENAKVMLNFAKHESEIKSDIGVMETTVTYEFQNTDTQNQEVIYSIELPNADSAMTELRLGLNLELTGTLAPRGAAERVYTDSLRRNIDPALLEQTSPTTYRLRVFPVLSRNDTKTQGRQRVQFKYVTPIHAGDMIPVIPKTDILNLKLTDNSEIMTRVTDGTKVLTQDSLKTNDIHTLNDGKMVDIDIEVTKDIDSFCSVNVYPHVDTTMLGSTRKNISKNIVFLDISKSAGKNKKIQDRYQELIDVWKNNGIALDIYTFNTTVTSAGYDITDISFWGNTDMAKVIRYIGENSIENANIVILTDDNSYEVALPEDKTIDYKKLQSNRISLLKIGGDIRTIKTEVTKSILATDGAILTLEIDGSIEESIKNLFVSKESTNECENYMGPSLSALQALQGYADGKKIVGSDTSSMTLLEEIGKSGHVVNQALSLIALETANQQNDLNRYSQGENRYDTTYQNLSSSQMMSPRSTNIGFGNQTTSLSMDDNVEGLSQGISKGLESTKNKSIGQYILIIILFPIISWYILRRKPKTQIEKKSEEKNSD